MSGSMGVHRWLFASSLNGFTTVSWRKRLNRYRKNPNAQGIKTQDNLAVREGEEEDEKNKGGERINNRNKTSCWQKPLKLPQMLRNKSIYWDQKKAIRNKL